VNFGTNKLIVIFRTVLGQKKFAKKYIHVPCNCVEFIVHRFLILGVLLLVLILFLELGCLGFSLFSIFF